MADLVNMQDVHPAIIRYMQNTGFFAKLKTQHELLSIEGDLKLKVIAIVGSCEAAGLAKSKITARIAILGQYSQKLDKGCINSFKDPTNRKSINPALKKNGLMATWHVEKGSLLVISSNSDAAQQSCNIIIKFLAGCHSEEPLRATPDSPSLVTEVIDRFDTALIRFMQHTGFLKRTANKLQLDSLKGDPKTKTITVCGSFTLVEAAKCELQKFSTTVHKYVGQMSRQLLNSFKSPHASKKINDGFNQHGLVVTWCIAGGKVTTYSSSDEAALKGFHIMEQVLAGRLDGVGGAEVSPLELSCPQAKHAFVPPTKLIEFSDKVSEIDSGYIRYMQHSGFFVQMEEKHKVSFNSNVNGKEVQIDGHFKAVNQAKGEMLIFIGNISRKPSCYLDPESLLALKSRGICKEINRNFLENNLIVSWDSDGSTINIYSNSSEATSAAFTIIKRVLRSRAGENSTTEKLAKRYMPNTRSHSAQLTVSGKHPNILDGISPPIQMYLSQSGFHRNIEQTYNLKFFFNKTKRGSILLEGGNVQIAKQVVEKEIQSLCHAVSNPLPRPLTRMLESNTAVRDEIVRLYKSGGLIAPWWVDGKIVTVCSGSQEDANNAIEVLESNLCHKAILLTTYEPAVVDEAQLVVTFNEKFEQKGQKVELSDQTITLYCTRSMLESAERKFKEYLENAQPQNTVGLNVEDGVLQYLERFALLDLKKISFGCFCRPPVFEHHSQRLILKGTSVAAYNCFRQISDDLLPTIKRKSVDFHGDPLRHYLNLNAKYVSDLEDQTRTILLLKLTNQAGLAKQVRVKELKMPPTPTNPRVTQLSLDNVQFEVVYGDITELKADAIVNSTGSCFDLTSGTLGPAILKKAGHQLKDALRPLNKHSSILRTDGYRLCKAIYHCVLPSSGNLESIRKLKSIIRSILADATKQKINSLLFPLLGAGNLGYDIVAVSLAILDQIVESAATIESSSKLDIKMVILPTQPDKMRVFRACLQRVASKTVKAAEPKPAPTLQAIVYTDIGLKSMEKVAVYYREPSAYDDLVTRLTRLREEKCRKIIWSDQYPKSLSMLPHLKTSELVTLAETAAGHNVQLRFYGTTSRASQCTLYGLTENVVDMEKVILQKLQTTRTDKFPPTWTQPLEGYSEPQLSSQSSEYAEVTQALNANLGRIATIKWIKRIQNPHQYEQFTAEQNKVASKLNKSPEAVSNSDLWHGSHAEVIEKICRNNFNRSFAGAHGVSYGHGCYFATTSKYSDLFSRGDKDGWKLIIKAKIVVGRYTVGDSSMKTAPYVGQTHEHYNTTVNNMAAPSIYVTFTDPAAYPEYVICYK